MQEPLVGMTFLFVCHYVNMCKFNNMEIILLTQPYTLKYPHLIHGIHVTPGPHGHDIDAGNRDHPITAW